MISARDDDLAASVAQALAGTSGPVYIGFSGGLDSTVLLHAAVAALAAAGGLAQLHALHVNHGLHADADSWERHCGALAANLGIDFIARRVSVAARGSLEARARTARYAVFAEYLAAPDTRLLLGHHRDDQAETILLRVLQGRGLYGMPTERSLAAGRLQRPFIEQPRSRLLAYAREAGLAWVEDPANADPALDRNFVRHRVLPALRTRFADVDAALVRAVTARAAEEACLAAAVGLDSAMTSLPLAVLFARDPREQRAVLRLWLVARGRAVPAARALDEFINQLRAGGDRQPCLRLDRGTLQRHRGRVWLCAPAPKLAEFYPITVPGELALPHGRLVIGPAATGYICHGAVVVRFRAGGESIRSRGSTRSVKSLFQDAGLAPWLRDSFPLVWDAHGVAAVPGLAVRGRERGEAPDGVHVQWLPDDPAGYPAAVLNT